MRKGTDSNRDNFLYKKEKRNTIEFRVIEVKGCCSKNKMFKNRTISWLVIYVKICIRIFPNRKKCFRRNEASNKKSVAYLIDGK